jgi:hypothetical protein
LSNEYFLRSVDDEVAPGIVGALIQVVHLLVGQVMKDAKFRPEHDRNLR